MKLSWFKFTSIIIVTIIALKWLFRPRTAITEPYFQVLGPLNATERINPWDYFAQSDYNELIDIQKFEFLINSYPCNHTANPLVMVIVSTKPDHFVNRDIIRKTWGKNTEIIKTVFLVGETVDTELNEKIAREHEMNHDIVKGNFIDAYRNMTYKHVMGLKWVSYHCSNARYILKMDDDVFVNMDSLIRFLVTVSPWGAKQLLLCEIHTNIIPERSYRSKWRVTYEEYPQSYYPTYCSGYAVLYSPDVVYQLYYEAQKSKYFWIDDVHITGLMAEKSNIKVTDTGSLRFTKFQEFLWKYFGTTRNFVFGPPDSSVESIMELWNGSINRIPVYHRNIISQSNQ